MLHPLLILVLLFMSIGSVQAGSQPEIILPIETVMTESELKRSGIGQLTEQELEILNQWLQLQSLKSLTRELVVQDPVVLDPVVQDRAVQNEIVELSGSGSGSGRLLLASLKREVPLEQTKIIYLDRRFEEVISTRIAGEFAGWRGKTLFKLDNGQIWRQRYSGYWKVKLDNPKVSIQKNGSGAYEMELVSIGKKIGVKRVR